MNPLFEIGTYIQIQGQRVTEPLKELPIEGLDHISYAFATIEENGSIKESARAETIPFSLVFDVKEISKLDESHKLQNFFASLKGCTQVTFLLTTPPPSTLLALCQKIAAHISLKFAIPGNVAQLTHLDLPSYEKYISAYDLLAYEYHNPKEGCVTEFHAILSDKHRPCIESSLEFLKDQGIDLKKINLGLASYGKLYKNVEPGVEGNGFGQIANGPQLSNPNLSYREIEAYILKHSAAKVYYTSTGGVLQSFIYNSENRDWIAFDDPDTLKGKVQWTEEKGLHGAFLWSSDQDNETFSELKAVEKGHNRKKWTKV